MTVELLQIGRSPQRLHGGSGIAAEFLAKFVIVAELVEQLVDHYLGQLRGCHKILFFVCFWIGSIN